jgi:hypothetical protein
MTGAGGAVSDNHRRRTGGPQADAGGGGTSVKHALHSISRPATNSRSRARSAPQCGQSSVSS